MLAATTIHVPAWGSVSLIDGSWLVIGAAGLAAVALGLRDSLRNLEVLAQQFRYFREQEEREAAVLIARNYVVHDLLRALTMVLITLVGIVASVVDQNPDVTPVGLFVTGLFFGVAGITLSHSALDRRQRRRLRAILRDGDAARVLEEARAPG